jgi:soluble lytic murein transglycosylase
MKLQSRLVLSVIFVLVFLCCTAILVKRNNIGYRDKVRKEESLSQVIFGKPSDGAHRDRVAKEEAVRRIIEYLRNENVTLKDKKLRTISEMVYKESTRYNLDYRLVLALMKIESNFRDDAVSEKGARGLLQVKPSVAKFIAEDVGIKWRGDETLDEPKENIRIGVHFFSKLIEDFQSTTMALHAYHVGPTRLREILGEEKIPQKRYLNLVLDEYDRNVTILPAP